MGRQHEQQLQLQCEDFASALGECSEVLDIDLDDLWHLYQRAQQCARLRLVGAHPLREIMAAPVVTVALDTPLAEAAALMLKQGISGLPVLDQGKLAGILTEGDLLEALGVPARKPLEGQLLSKVKALFHTQAPSKGMENVAGDIMTRQVVTASADDTLQHAFALMRKHHVNRIVITGPQQQVEGIVTRSNIIHFNLQETGKYVAAPPPTSHARRGS